MGNTEKITPDLVEHVAHLAMIELRPEEKEKFAKQMQDIVNYFDILTEVNVENIPPTTHVMDIKNVFREDKPQKSLSQKEALQNASETEEGFIKAPRII